MSESASVGISPATQASVHPSARRQTLAVVLMTKNEEARLADCLDRVAGWADEIVVIDDLSTDRTVEIARRYTDKIFPYASEDDHYRQWNRGIDHATSDWILHIDADEHVTALLRAAIDEVLRSGTPHDAFTVMRRNYFLGRPMRYGGWYHPHLIFFRRDRARCVGSGIHVRLRVDGAIGSLPADIHHYPFATVAQFLTRQNLYTTVEAKVLLAERGRLPWRVVLVQLTLRPLKLFWKFYVKKQGRRDGWHGLVFSGLFAVAHWMLWAKYWELMTNDQIPSSK
ncbi:MAG: glycosyltransferase family 2 protein [Candidatus Omnitrophica bacterium]|nr:glycosyltransferase family 2 protein [Candidatus Omnitrophota bacterium]